MNKYILCVCVYFQIYFLKILLASECDYVFPCKHTGSSRIFKRVLVRSVKHVEIPAGKLTCDYTLLFVKVDDGGSSQLQVECVGGGNTRP